MASVDLSPLIRGVLVIIGLSISLGQYGRLERWARKQALLALSPNGWPELRFEFTPEAPKPGLDYHSVYHYSK